MPYRKRPRAISTRYKRRRYRSRSMRKPMRKRSYRKKYNTVVMPQSYPFPSRLFAKVKYEGMFLTNTTSNVSPGINLFRGNNAFKPSFSASGSCSGYSQISAPYRNCTVIGSKINVFYVDNGSAETSLPQITVVPQVSVEPTYTVPDLTQIGEIRRAKYRYMEPAQSSNSSRGTIKHYTTTASMFNLPKSDVKNNPDLYGHAVAVATPPQKEGNWLIYTCSPGLGAVAAVVKINMRVSITYYIMLNDIINSPT